MHGGVAQGIAQALYEEALRRRGQPDHGDAGRLPVPFRSRPAVLELDATVTPSPTNPLGVKGIGESGAIGSSPAVLNAVVDAVAHLGVRHIDMPATPEKVWRAIRAAGQTS